jgi:ribosomal protein S18 acetylase RimI-like enzyme
MGRGAPGDLDGLERLLRAVIAGMRAQGLDQWDEVYPTREVLARDVAAGELWVASLGPIAGALVLNTHQDPEYGEVAWELAGRVAVVHRLMTDPAVQGRGVARALMAFAEDEARSRGFDAIRLDAFAQNARALELYARLGYRKAGEVTFRKGRFHCFEKAL